MRIMRIMLCKVFNSTSEILKVGGLCLITYSHVGTFGLHLTFMCLLTYNK